jgi:hypothetical protein
VDLAFGLCASCLQILCERALSSVSCSVSSSCKFTRLGFDLVCCSLIASRAQDSKPKFPAQALRAAESFPAACLRLVRFLFCAAVFCVRFSLMARCFGPIDSNFCCLRPCLYFTLRLLFVCRRCLTGAGSQRLVFVFSCATASFCLSFSLGQRSAGLDFAFSPSVP